ncbi:MAG: hypothetical protein ACXAE3_17250 [Candidatus Kariarchaeaceae archaeon]
MVLLTLQVHPSIRPKSIPGELQGQFGNVSILQAIRMLIENTELESLLLIKGGLKPGLLAFAGKTELVSLGLLTSTIDQDIHVRIVPILHGG